MDGFEFLSRFRKLKDAEKVPVIVVTAKDLSPEERDELAGHVSDIFTKEEDDIEDLIRTVSSVVGDSKHS